jgi:hypothetical protein
MIYKEKRLPLKLSKDRKIRLLNESIKEELGSFKSQYAIANDVAKVAIKKFK